MSANKKTALCVAIAATLSACGGGSDDGQATTPTTTPTINKVSGKVADGYIKGARVFWDCNSNQIYDAGEVSVFTKAGGNFEIDSRQNCDLAVYVPETAIDEDTGLMVNRSYTMLTPKGSESFISPLTTMVQARSIELREQGIMLEVADERAFTDVKMALNLSNPLGNYISDSSMIDALKAHNTAKLAATLYQEDASAPISRKAKAVISIIQPISNNILNVNQGLNVLQPMLGNNNWLADISFDDKAILEAALGQTRLAARENTSLSDTQLLILKSIISDEDVRKSALYSHIDWDNVSLDKKKALLQALRAANIEPTSTNLLQQYRSERNADIEKALADFETKMDSSNQFWSRDLNENASFFIDTGLSSLNASLYTAKLFASSTPASKAAESVARKVFKEKFKNFQYRAAKNAKALQYLDPDTLGLLKDSADVLALDNLKDCISGKKSVDALSSQDMIDITTLAIKITSVAFDEVKALKNAAKGLKVFADVVDGTGNVVVGASASEKIEGVVLLIESGAALAGISELENTAGLIKTFFEAYNRGKEYADKVDSEVNKAQAAIIADFDRQTRRVFNLYTAHVLNQIVFDHIEFLPAGTCDASSYSVNGQCLPIIRVSSWSPQQATVGQETTFTLNGYGFKAGIGYTVEGCSNLKTVSLTENQFKFSCTPTASSDKHLIIKDKPDGTELFNQVVAVSDVVATPTCANAVSSVICEDFNGGVAKGVANGVTFVNSPNGQAASFSRASESRIQYPFSSGLPKEGTLEFIAKIDSMYRYENYVMKTNEACALLFTTDIQGGDVTWPGSAWLYVCNNGDVSFHIAGEKYEPGWNAKYRLAATATNFRFGEWHRIGVSYGSQGRDISVDGQIVASNTAQIQQLGAGGTHSSPIDTPTIGEPVPGFWKNNQWEGGFEGAIDAFRASVIQKDWHLSK